MDKKPEEFYDLMESVLFTHNYRPNSEAHRRLKLAKRQFVKRYAELKGIEESYLSSDEELADNSSSQLVSRPEKHSRVPVDISAVRLNDKGGRMTNTSVAWCYKIAARLTQVDYEGLSALERYEILHFLCDRASDLKEIQEVINEKDEEIRSCKRKLVYRTPKHRNGRVLRLAGKKLWEFQSQRRTENTEKNSTVDGEAAENEDTDIQSEVSATPDKEKAVKASSSNTNMKVVKDENKVQSPPVVEKKETGDEEDDEAVVVIATPAVDFDEKHKKWKGRIVEGSTSYIIGLFDTQEEAKKACESVIGANIDRKIAIAATQQKYQGGAKKLKEVVSTTIVDSLITPEKKTQSAFLAPNGTSIIGVSSSLTQAGSKRNYPRSTIRAIVPPLTSLMIEYMEEEHASKKSSSPGEDFLFQVNEWGSNGVIEKFYSVLGGFS